MTVSRTSRAAHALRASINAAAALHPAAIELRILDALSRNIPRQLRETRIPAFQCALAIGDRPVRTIAFGAATSDTPFTAASLGKPLAAAVALIAHQHRLIDLDRPLDDLLLTLPSLAHHPRTTLAQITLRSLLTHASGIADCNMPHVPAGEPVPTLHDALHGYVPLNLRPRTQPTLAHEPGLKTRYSGHNYALLEWALEHLTNTPFPTLGTTLLFKPTHRRCTFDFRSAASHTLAQPHTADATPFIPETPIALASSGLIATAADVVTIMQRLLCDSRTITRDALLAPAHARCLFTLFDGIATPPTYTHSLHRCRGIEPLCLDHHGHRPGLRATLNIIPDAGITIAMLANSDGGEELFFPILAMTRAIARASCGLPTLPYPAPPASA